MSIKNRHLFHRRSHQARQHSKLKGSMYLCSSRKKRSKIYQNMTSERHCALPVKRDDDYYDLGALNRNSERVRVQDPQAKDIFSFAVVLFSQSVMAFVPPPFPRLQCWCNGNGALKSRFQDINIEFWGRGSGVDPSGCLLLGRRLAMTLNCLCSYSVYFLLTSTVSGFIFPHITQP